MSALRLEVRHALSRISQRAAEVLSKSNKSRHRSRAFMPIARASSGFSSRQAIFFAKARGISLGHDEPGFLVRDHLETAATSVETTGRPAAIASMITVGRLSIAPSSALVQERTNIRDRSSSRLISPSAFGPVIETR